MINVLSLRPGSVIPNFLHFSGSSKMVFNEMAMPYPVASLPSYIPP